MRPGMVRSEEGSITLWLASLTGALFVLLGLVWAGGDALAAKARASSDAFAAARAGAEALSADGLATGMVTLDPAAATQAAQNALAADGEAGTVAVNGRTVTVTVRTTVPGGLLGLVGIRDLTVSGDGKATATPGA